MELTSTKQTISWYIGWNWLKLVEVGLFFRRGVEVGWSRLKLGGNGKWALTNETNRAVVLLRLVSSAIARWGGNSRPRLRSAVAEAAGSRAKKGELQVSSFHIQILNSTVNKSSQVVPGMSPRQQFIDARPMSSYATLVDPMKVLLSKLSNPSRWWNPLW